MEKYVNNEDFVAAWVHGMMQGKTKFEIADSLGISRQSLYNRRNRLKQKGVRLPEVTSNRPQIRVEELNNLIDKLMNQGGDSE